MSTIQCFKKYIYEVKQPLQFSSFRAFHHLHHQRNLAASPEKPGCTSITLIACVSFADNHSCTFYLRICLFWVFHGNKIKMMFWMLTFTQYNVFKVCLCSCIRISFYASVIVPYNGVALKEESTVHVGDLYFQFLRGMSLRILVYCFV